MAKPRDTAPEQNELQARFRTLVLSPLLQGLIRFFHARPHESFDTETLMQTFGRLDVDNCIRELVAWGAAERAPGSPPRYRAAGRHLLDDRA